jgi:hypothetical protein
MIGVTISSFGMILSHGFASHLPEGMYLLPCIFSLSSTLLLWVKGSHAALSLFDPSVREMLWNRFESGFLFYFTSHSNLIHLCASSV